jgi:hypothetical protein
LRNELPRLFELKDLIEDPSHPDAYFRDFEHMLQDPSCFETFTGWEKELESTDPVAWDDLKRKSARYLEHRDRKKGRGWQQLFDVLAEASAYRYLKESEQCSKIRFIPESPESIGRTPDLEAMLGNVRVLCDAKTVNISDDEISARSKPATVRKGSDRLDAGLFRKLDSDIANAKDQMQRYDPTGDTRRIVFIRICFDDWAGLYMEDYLQQIVQHLSEHPPAVKVVVRPDRPKTEVRIVAQ